MQEITILQMSISQGTINKLEKQFREIGQVRQIREMAADVVSNDRKLNDV